MNHLYHFFTDEQLVAQFLRQFAKNTRTKAMLPMPERGLLQRFLPGKRAKMQRDQSKRDISLVRLAQEGRAEALYKIGMALLRLTRDGSPEIQRVESWFYLRNLDFILALTPDSVLVETLLKLCAVRVEIIADEPEAAIWNRPTPVGVNSFAASLLACGQQRAVLLAALAQHIDDEQYLEVLSFLVQELVIRGVRGIDYPLLQRWHTRMHEHHLPLAWLPLELSALETDIVPHKFTLSSDGGFGGGKGEHFLNKFDDYAISQLVNDNDPTTYTFTETTTEDERAKIRAALSDWEEDSNGNTESRSFAIQPPLVQGKLSEQDLLALHLECLEGNEVSSTWLKEISPVGVLKCLYEAAAFGGAYSWGHKGARGRLETWYSLAGLVGAEENSTFEQVLKRVQQTRWYFFLGSKWFRHVTWDLGLVAIRPERDTLAVLAATDTD